MSPRSIESIEVATQRPHLIERIRGVGGFAFLFSLVLGGFAIGYGVANRQLDLEERAVTRDRDQARAELAQLRSDYAAVATTATALALLATVTPRIDVLPIAPPVATSPPIVAAPTQVIPLATPTPRTSSTLAPTPSPSPVPAGSVIYETTDFANWSVSAAGTPGWKLVANTLVTDNSLDQNHPIWAPVTLATANYAVTASIEVLDQDYPVFGIIGRDGYSLGVSGLPVAGSNLVIFRCCKNIVNPALIGTNELGRKQFNPPKRTPLDYTAELNGTNLRVSVNGNVLETADTTYLRLFREN